MLFVYAVRRSGHHGIINWLCKQFKSAEFYDDGVVSDSQISTARVHKYIGAESSNKSLLIYNFENRPTFDLQIGERLKFDEYKYIVIVRDIYNNFASYYRGMGDTAIEFKKKNLLQLWKNHIKLILENKDIINIKFNSWYENKSYKKSILDLLNINNVNDNISTIGIENTRWGQSSFGDEIITDTILSRYSAFLKDNEYRTLFDEEGIALNKKVFGFWIDFTTGTKVLMDSRKD